MGLVLFTLLISDLNEGTECTCSRSDDDTKLGGVADTPKCCAAVLQDMARHRSQAERSLVKFKEGKCKVLRLRKKNPGH